LESSPWVRITMAAGLYLLVIWGHLSLAGGTAFAIFYAFAMSAMLVYWSDQSALKPVDAESISAALGDYQDLDELSPEDWRQIFDADQIMDGVEPVHAWDKSQVRAETETLRPVDRETLRSALTRLDVIKAELKSQYAQLGKDQTAWRSGDRWRFDGL